MHGSSGHSPTLLCHTGEDVRRQVTLYRRRLRQHMNHNKINKTPRFDKWERVWLYRLAEKELGLLNRFEPRWKLSLVMNNVVNTCIKLEP